MTGMETAFDKALAFVLRFEGGLSKDAVDPAALQVDPGEVHTAYGITQATYDAHRYRAGEARQSVALIKRDEVAHVYLNDYWKAYRLDEVAHHAPNFAMCLFDGYVQHRPDNNTKLWQRSVQSEPDGIVGPNTLMKTEYRVSVVGEPLVCAAYLERRYGLYAQIIRNDPPLQKFRKGWRRRLNELCRTVGLDPVWPV